MLRSIYKLLPFFIVEYIAKMQCERINTLRDSKFIELTVFTDTILKIKR